MNYVEHPFQPVFDTHSSILILGTIPSPQSRIHGFYYSHPQNAFWKVLTTLLEDTLPLTPKEKEAFLLRHHIALWDVLHACEIEGSSDSHIRKPIPNDFSHLLKVATIQQIFTTGKKQLLSTKNFANQRLEDLLSIYRQLAPPTVIGTLWKNYWKPIE